MTIKSNSFIAHYYRWMFRGALASNFCTLFWNTLLSILLLVLTIPAFLASLVIDRDIWDKPLIGKAFRGLITYFAVFLGICFGLAMFEKAFGDIWRQWGFWQVIGAALVGLVGIALIIIVGFGAIIGVCAGFYYAGLGVKRMFQEKKVREYVDEEGYSQTETYYSNKPNNLVVLWNTIRNKYCTKIEWKEN